MNEYKIWQVREDDPEAFREYGFCSLDRILERHPAFRGGPEVLATLPRDAWECAYVFRTDAEPSLDWLFARFQHGAGRAGYLADQRARETELNFTGHSLSVSDIIETPDGKLWFCDSFGWKRVRWSPEEEAEA